MSDPAQALTVDLRSTDAARLFEALTDRDAEDGFGPSVRAKVPHRTSMEDGSLVLAGSNLYVLLRRRDDGLRIVVAATRGSILAGAALQDASAHLAHRIAADLIDCGPVTSVIWGPNGEETSPADFRGRSAGQARVHPRRIGATPGQRTARPSRNGRLTPNRTFALSSSDLSPSHNAEIRLRENGGFRAHSIAAPPGRPAPMRATIAMAVTIPLLFMLLSTLGPTAPVGQQSARTGESVLRALSDVEHTAWSGPTPYLWAR